MFRSFVAVAVAILAVLVSGERGGGLATASHDEGGRYLISLAPSFLTRASPGDPGERLRDLYRARFNELEPLLQWLQLTGALNDYEDRVGDGVVAVEATAAGVAHLRGFLGEGNVYDDTRAGLRALADRHASLFDRAAALAGPRAAGAAPPITANMEIGSSNVNGNAPDGLMVYGALVDAAGNVIMRGRDRSEGGYYSLSFCQYECRQVFGGYTVRLKAGANTASVKVPNLYIQGNRATDVVSGRAPRNKGVLVKVTHYEWTAGGQISNSTTLGTVVDGQGRYSQKFTPFVDIEGGDYLQLTHNLPGNAGTVTIDTSAPYIYAYLDHTEVGGTAAPLTERTFTVKNKRGRTVLSRKVFTEVDGDFYLETVTAGTTAGMTGVALRTGMKLALNEQGVLFTLPRLTARFNYAPKTITGRGPGNTGVQFYVNAPYPCGARCAYSSGYGAIPANGLYSVDVTPSSGDLNPRSRGYILVRLPSGDRVYRTWG